MTNSTSRWLLLALFLLYFLTTSKVFSDMNQTTPNEGEKKEEPKEEFRDEVSVTEHEILLQGKKISYTATAGTYAIRDDEDKPKARFFFVSYMKNESANKKASNKKPAAKDLRPLTFCFNGGPGSSSIWLHLGMLGPHRVNIPDDASTAPPPYKTEPNPHSLLDLTDLVFIDPVSTGYSEPHSEIDKKDFHGYQADIESVGQFIHRFLNRNQRWASPLYLLGESYGTLRAAGLSGHLFDRYHIALNGIVMISSVIDFQTLIFNKTNDLPYVLFLPTYTATAWYHNKLKPKYQKDLDKTLREVEQFATDDYLVALFKGNSLSDDERQRIAQRLAEYTGLSEDFVHRSNLRIQIFQFTKELLRDQRQTVGRLDSRYLGADRESVSDTYEYDPSDAAISTHFTHAMYDYLQRDLEVHKNQTYEVLNGKVWPWSYKSFENDFAQSQEILRKSMNQNPHLKIFVANGYYDLATPYFGTLYSYRHLEVIPRLSKRIEMGFYKAGHMMYIHEPSMSQLRKDLQKFYIPSER